MRHTALVFALAACAPASTITAPIDVPVGDVPGLEVAVPDVVAVADAPGDVRGDAAGPDAGDVAVAVDVSAACVPACGAGMRCTDGRCVVDGDAGADAADASTNLYRTCEPVGSSCGAGLMCSAVPGLVNDAGVQGVCTRACAASAECSNGALCVTGVCMVECALQGDETCVPWQTRCRASRVRAPDSVAPPGIPGNLTAYCAA